jgi:hypothetical protein
VRVERHASPLSLARVARQVLCTNRRFYEPVSHSDKSNPALDRRSPTATATANRDTCYFVAGTAFGEAGLPERVECRHGRGHKLGTVPLRYKGSLRL